MERVWRERLRKRREFLERWQREDTDDRREGFASPLSKICADNERPALEEELLELKVFDALCEYGEDAFHAAGV